MLVRSGALRGDDMRAEKKNVIFRLQSFLIFRSIICKMTFLLWRADTWSHFNKSLLDFAYCYGILLYWTLKRGFSKLNILVFRYHYSMKRNFHHQFNIQQLRSAHIVFMCFVFIWEQTATCATYSINWLVFITEMKSVYSAVRTGPLNKVVCASSLKG